MNTTSLKRTIRLGETGYPQFLDQIQLPPELLFTLGTYEEKDTLSVAIVGSRTPTPYGIWAARTLARGLCSAGVTIVSGMARGIDTAAHEAALEVDGRTIAILGCGLDIDYPRGNKALKGRIAENGLVITEFSEGTPPLARNFPQRNRIISGLSLAVVVVEAGMKSGSLITAKWALDQGREVMAVPGRIDSRLSDGPNFLIRDGAQPVECAEDIINALGIERKRPGKDNADHDDIPVIIRQLETCSMRVEELAQCMGMKVDTVSAELSKLELMGQVVRGPGGYFIVSGRTHLQPKNRGNDL